jgi:hypothetical protein
VNALTGTIENEMVCSRLAASFTGRYEEIGRHVMSVSGPYTTEGVLDRFCVCSSPGVRKAVLALQVKAARPVTARAVS